MHHRLSFVIETISKKNILHGKKLKNNFHNADSDYLKKTEAFLVKYEHILKKQHKDLDYAVTCYLQMLADVHYESVQFVKTGKYSNTCFADVNKKVYSNPQVMEYYMHALLLRQFLLPQNYAILNFFDKTLRIKQAEVNNYLEVGGGHGLFISNAVEVFGNQVAYDLLDISKNALELAGSMLENKNVNFIHADIFEFNTPKKYDFITLGEVLEHVENPLDLLIKIKSMLTKNGTLFLTTITNAPAIDHIYLFRNADEIRNLIKEAAYTIEDELCTWSEDVSPEKAEKFKVSMMYAGVLVIK